MSEASSTVLKHFDTYVEKLVDLTARNRLLKYPKRSVRICFSQDVISLREHGYDYHDFSVCWSEADIRKIGDEEKAEDSEAVVPDRDDCWLLRNTDPKGERLIKQLTNFKRDQRRILEEHGVHSLYLAVGTISWTEEVAVKKGQEKIKKEFCAPILLIPISITREKKGSIQWHVAQTEGQESEINLALRLYLKRRQKGINLDFPDVANLNVEEAGQRFVEAFREVGIAVEYKNEAYIGQFAFSGQHIHEDLKNNQEQFLNQDIIRAVCGDLSAINGEESARVDLHKDPDELLKPSEDFGVLNADPSQLQVVSMGVADRSFVVQGPPGTGKSQTIVNLLTNLAARGKNVLFVCEKRVAMEVVYRRLTECNLRAICLPIFELNRNNRVNIAKNVCDDASRVSALVRGIPALEKLMREREGVRTRLCAYTNLLGGVIQPLDRSLHWVYTEMAREMVDGRMLVKWDVGQHNPFEKTAEEYSRTVDLLRQGDFVSYQAARANKAKFDWIQATLPEKFAESCIEKIRDLKEQIASLEGRGPLVGKNDLVSLVRALNNATDEMLLQTLWLFKEEADFGNISDVLDSCAELIEEYKKITADHPDGLKLSINQWAGVSPHKDEEIDQIEIDDVLRFVEQGEPVIKILKRSLKTISTSSLLLESRHEIQRLYLLGKLDIDLLNSLPDEVNYVAIKIAISHLEKVEKAQAQQNTIQEEIATTWGVNLVKASKEVVDCSVELELAAKSPFRLLAYILPKYRKAAGRIRSMCLMGPTSPKYLSHLALRIGDFQRVDKERLGLEKQIADLLGRSSFDKGDVERIIVAFQGWHNVTGLESLDSSVMQKLFEIRRNDEIATVIRVLGDHFAWLDALIAKYPSLQQADLNTQRQIERGINLFDRMKEASSHLVGLDAIKNFSSQKTVAEFIEDIAHRDAINAIVEQYASRTQIAKQNLGDIHEAGHTHKVISACEEVRRVVKNLTDAGVDLVGTSLEQIRDLLVLLKSNDFKKDAQRAAESVHGFAEEFNATALERIQIGQANVWLDDILSDISSFKDWQAYKVFLEKAQKLQIAWFVERSATLEPSLIIPSFVYSYWQTWLHAAKESGLQILSPDELNEASSKFRELDTQVLSLNHARILSAICKSDKYTVPSAMLRHESGKKRQLKPLRSLVSDAPTAKYLQTAKPIWMMSPSAVSASLGGSSIKFDYVVFDESSQLRVEHSLPALARAKQVIAFGDEHQLPPTSFFFTSDVQEEDDEEEVALDILSSLGTVFSGASKATLNFHYRSRYEELIAFSNNFVYENRLITSPNPSRSAEAVKFVYVEDGVFSDQMNMVEAKEVARICIEEAVRHPEQSLGVIAFSRRQEVAIRDAVLELVRGNAEAEILLDEERDIDEPFFIKNLENVQGDERDRIILSVGYGPEKAGGKVAQRFGPLNSRDGYRRLNVAVTRSKVQMICVSSMKAEDVKIDEGNVSRGRMMLRKFLEYSERGIAALEAQVGRNQESETENDFEQTIMNALVARGLNVHPQVGVSNYRIDLGIVHPKDQTRYVLGVECDGATYHSSYSARLNDRLRQEHLENLGWKMHRIWSSDWAERPNEIADEIVAKVQSLSSE